MRNVVVKEKCVHLSQRGEELYKNVKRNVWKCSVQPSSWSSCEKSGLSFGCLENSTSQVLAKGATR